MYYNACGALRLKVDLIKALPQMGNGGERLDITNKDAV